MNSLKSDLECEHAALQGLRSTSHITQMSAFEKQILNQSYTPFKFSFFHLSSCFIAMRDFFFFGGSFKTECT